MKNNIVMLAFASILATTATDWAVAGEPTFVPGNAAQQNNEPLRDLDKLTLSDDKSAPLVH